MNGQVNVPFCPFLFCFYPFFDSACRGSISIDTQDKDNWFQIEAVKNPESPEDIEFNPNGIIRRQQRNNNPRQIKMAFKTRIQEIEKSQILAVCGPMRLVIAAWSGQIPQKEVCIRAAREAFIILERVSRQRKELSLYYRPSSEKITDSPAGQMIQSVLTVDHELTPMAAVAGTIADSVADFLIRQGMTRVIVNNGGDIAIRTTSGTSVRIGIRAEMARNRIVDIITLGDEQRTWGVATSGVEGRSLSRGVASAATIIAPTASLADAAATSVANASYVKDDSVIQQPAETLDPQTDIPGISVTVRAGPFSEQKKDEALAGALKKVHALIDKKVIYGAYIAVDGKTAMTDFVRCRLA